MIWVSERCKALLPLLLLLLHAITHGPALNTQQYLNPKQTPLTLQGPRQCTLAAAPRASVCCLKRLLSHATCCQLLLIAPLLHHLVVDAC